MRRQENIWSVFDDEVQSDVNHLCRGVNLNSLLQQITSCLLQRLPGSAETEFRHFLNQSEVLHLLAC